MEWRKIEGFPKYSVSDTGLVRNDRTGYILKEKKPETGIHKLVCTWNRKTSNGDCFIVL